MYSSEYTGFIEDMRYNSSYPVIGFLVLLVIVGGYFAIVGAIASAARRKNRSFGAFFWLSLLISPLITGLVVAALPFDESDPRHPKNKARAYAQPAKDAVTQDTDGDEPAQTWN